MLKHHDLQFNSLGFHENNNAVPFHDHLQDEFIISAQGSCTVECANRESYDIKLGECLYIPAHCTHNQVASKKSSNYYLKYYNAHKIFGLNPLVLEISNDKILLDWCRHLQICERDLAQPKSVLIQSLAQAWIERLIALNPQHDQRLKGSRTLLQAEQFLEQHYREDLSLRDIAQHCQVSISHLGHLFREDRDYAPMDYLRIIRMRHAQRLLQDDYLSIAEVGKAVGYPDPNYFTRIFRISLGLSPRKWRKDQNILR